MVLIKTAEELKVHADMLIIEAMLEDSSIIKVAQSGSYVGPLIEKTKEYAEAHIDKENPTKSVVNLLAPAAVKTLFDAMGFKWISLLMGLLTKFLNVDVYGIIGNMASKVKSLLQSKTPISSSHIDSIAQEAANYYADEGADFADDVEFRTTAQQLQSVRTLKLALLEYEATGKIVLAKGIFNSYSTKSNAISIFSKVVGFIFKVILSAAGFMVAGDVINKTIGRPSALDKVFPTEKAAPEQEGFFSKILPKSAPKAIVPTTTQTKFKPNPSYSDIHYNSDTSNWKVDVTNSKENVAQTIVNFAKEVYSGLDNLDSVIRSSHTFQVIVDQISFFNRTTLGDPMIWIPRQFVSKKQIVDLFIDEVAAKSS